MPETFSVPDQEDRYRQTRRKVFSGAKALGVRHVLVGLLSLAGSTLLIREVGPAPWASYGIAYLLITFADQSFSTRVLGHLVRTEIEPDERDIATASALMAGVGIVVLAAFVALSGPISDLYGRDDLAACLVAVGVCGLVYALRTTSTSLLERSMNYRAIGVAEVVDQVTFYAVALVAVVAGAGITGIAVALAARGVVAAVLLHRARPVPLFGRIDRERLRPILRFAGPSLLTGLVLLLDGLIAPVILGGEHAVELGFYLTTGTIAGYGVAVAVVSQRISLPGLASLQGDPQRFAHGLARGLSVTTSTVISCLAPLVATSPLWLGPLLGDQWDVAAPAMIVYAAGLAASTFVHALGYSLASLGWPRDALLINVVMTASFALITFLLVSSTPLLACPIGFLASRVLGIPVALAMMRYRGRPVRWGGQVLRLALGTVTFVLIGLLLDDGRYVEAAVAATVGTIAWLRVVRADIFALVRGLRGSGDPA